MLYGLGDATTDRLAKIKDLQDRISALNVELKSLLDTVYSLTHGLFTQDLASSELRAAQVQAANIRIADIQTQINILTLELNALLETDAKVTNALAATPAAVANANMKAVTDYRQQLFFLAQAGYDYGKGSARRNAEYKGLGDIMPSKTSHSLYNLHRQDGLSGIFDDIFTGGRAAISNYKASGVKLPTFSSTPLPNIPGGPRLAGMKLPAWMRALGPAAVAGAMATVGKKRTPPTSGTIATGGAEPTTYESPAPNYLGWGLAAVAVGVALKVVRGSK